MQLITETFQDFEYISFNQNVRAKLSTDNHKFIMLLSSQNKNYQRDQRRMLIRLVAPVFTVQAIVCRSTGRSYL